MVVGSASADDCAVKPLTSSAAKWGKRLFIGRIPIEATIDNVQLYFGQWLCFGCVSCQGKSG